MTIFRPVRTAAVWPLLLSALAACGDPFTLPPASLPTAERIVILYALTGTAISQPSAFNVANGLEVRPDRSPDFDFAVDFVVDSTLGLGTTGDTVVALLPRGAIGFAADPGVQVVDTPYDSLLLAPVSGYIKDRAVRVDSGDVVVVSSRVQSCNFGFVRPLYAKFRVDVVDRPLRRIVTTLLTDPNCGYRGLGPGVPPE